MGKDFFDASPAAKEVFELANRVIGFDLATLCFTGPEDRLNQTDISQPAISKHLKVLERAGLVSASQDAQRRPRRLEAEPLTEASVWLEQCRETRGDRRVAGDRADLLAAAAERLHGARRDAHGGHDLVHAREGVAHDAPTLVRLGARALRDLRRLGDARRRRGYRLRHLLRGAGDEQRLTDLLLGAARPVHILTPSATVRRIVNMTALAVADANAPRGQESLF